MKNFYTFMLFNAAAMTAFLSGCAVAEEAPILSPEDGAGYSAESLQTEKKEADCILQDDFEGDISPFKDNVGRGAELEIVSGKRALSGKKSLSINSMSSSEDWIVAAELTKNFKLDSGRAYVVEFKYNLLETGKQSANNYVSVVGDGGVFYGRTIFAVAAGQKGKSKLVFIVPTDAKNPILRLSSHGASRLILDDVKIGKLDIDVNSWIFSSDAFIGMRKTPTNPNMLDFSNPSFYLPKDKYFPMLDEFGQFKYVDWKDKPHSVDDLKADIVREQDYNKKRSDIPARDKFGGWEGSAGSAPKTAGFTTDKVDGKWFLRDPEGNLFWSVGATCVGAFTSTPITDREFYFEKIDPKYVVDGNGYKPGTTYYNRAIKIYNLGKRNIALKYGENGIADYWKVVAPRFKKWGMNTYGAWSSRSVMESKTVPFTACLGSAGAKPLETKRKLWALWGNIPDYFAPSFAVETTKRIAQSAKLLESEFCIGAFVDNEISWQSKMGVTALAVLSCPATQPAKIEMQKMLEAKYKSIAALNSAWKTSYADWGDFLTRTDIEPKIDDAKADLYEFERLFVEHYFKTCRDAVKKACPKALYMGCRFAAGENDITSRAAYEVCDVVSCNIYKADVSFYKAPEGAKDKPVIIGEFHIARIDKGSPYGGLLEVPNAKAAAKAYKKYMNSAIDNPQIVGAHWFQWSDMFITGRADGANATCGFVSVTDAPDYALADACRSVSSKMYERRTGK